MRGFLKILLASFVAGLLVVALLAALGISLVGKATEDEKPEVKPRTVLVLDVSKPIMDQRVASGFDFPEGSQAEIMGLYDLVVALDVAATDSAVKGIMLIGGSNPNGFATSQELRQALEKFKRSKKFIVANSSYMNQRSYELANLADSIFINPAGGLEWQGYSYQLTFFKKLLDKLEVKPEIFYAGKFKSFTEPYRLTSMSEPNRQQVTNFLEDIYRNFQLQTAESRGIDTSTVRALASRLALATTADAVSNKLVDAGWYDDEVRLLIGKRIGVKDINKINFMPMADYVEADRGPKNTSTQTVALVFAQGDIVDGKGEDGSIGGDKLRNQLRSLRLNDRVKAVVVRVNSPGGSALASEVIYREMELLRKAKPLVVSMGDYAASGGYYISAPADSIFAMPATLTGSIGVFNMLFDASQLMNNKLGITFDEVTTSPSATLGSPFRPMAAAERLYIQRSVDSTYARFLDRVAVGRRLTLSLADSLGQGRVWSGEDALQNGLADHEGGITAAIACAARMAKLSNYRVRQYPEVRSFWQKLTEKEKDPNTSSATAWHIRQQLGEEFYQTWLYVRQLKTMSGHTQMRLPFFVQPKP